MVSIKTDKMQKTNEKMLRQGLKEVEKLGVLAPALLRERLATLLQAGIADVKKTPERYNTPIANSNDFLKVMETFLNEIKFSDQ